MNTYFTNKTKAEVLFDLSKKKIKFIVPKTYFFNVGEWKNNRETIIQKIITKFKGVRVSSVAIRSSAIEEDNENSSNAGKFSSELRIPLKKTKLISSIKRIIKSYEKIKKKKFIFKKSNFNSGND